MNEAKEHNDNFVKHKSIIPSFHYIYSKGTFFKLTLIKTNDYGYCFPQKSYVDLNTV